MIFRLSSSGGVLPLGACTCREHVPLLGGGGSIGELFGPKGVCGILAFFPGKLPSQSHFARFPAVLAELAS